MLRQVSEIFRHFAKSLILRTRHIFPWIPGHSMAAKWQPKVLLMYRLSAEKRPVDIYAPERADDMIQGRGFQASYRKPD